MKQIVLFILLFISVAESHQYQPLSDINFTDYSAENIRVENYQVRYTYRTQNDQDPLFYKQAIGPISESVFTYARSQGLPLEECKALNDLDIFEINTSVLNNEARFSQWKSNSPDTNVIWGLYDPLILFPNESVIVMTDHGKKANEEIFAHEMAHYWYDRFCWAQAWDGNSESFARAFQQVFVQSL